MTVRDLMVIAEDMPDGLDSKVTINIDTGKIENNCKVYKHVSIVEYSRSVHKTIEVLAANELIKSESVQHSEIHVRIKP